MSGAPGSFRPEEISGPEASIRGGDVAEAYAAARALEHAMSTDPVRPSADFVDRVMVALVTEPAPRPAGFLLGIGARPGFASFVASFREAWAAVGGASGRPFGVRAAALAYVLVVLMAAVSLTGVAALGTAGAFGLLSRDASATPTEVVASPAPDPTSDFGPIHSPEPSDSAAPSDSAQPDDSLDPGTTRTPKPTTRPGVSESPARSDDAGASASPGTSDDSGHSGSPSPSDGPKPSETPH